MSVPEKENIDRVTFAYKQNTTLDPDVREALGKFDLTGDGRVTASELMAGAQAIETLKNQGRFLRKIVMALLVVVLALLLGMFGLTVLAIDLSKETKMQGQTLATVAGDEVLVASSATTMEGGKMVEREGGRRLGDEANAVQTGEALTASPLTSVIPDEYMSQIKFLTITSADGAASVKLAIESVSRRVTALAKCGSVVELQTVPTGTVTLDDTDVSFSGSELTSLLENLGLSAGGELTVSGSRRLAAGATMLGMFNFIADYTWTCESISKPDVNFAVLRTGVATYVDCLAEFCAESAFGDGKPGYLPAGGGSPDDNPRLRINARMLANNARVVTITTYPNHPLAAFVESINAATGEVTTYRSMGGEMYNCSTKNTGRRASGAEALTSASHFLAFDGITTYKGKEFEKFAIVTRGEEDQNAQHFQLWTRDGVPARVVAPANKKAASLLFFNDFTFARTEAENPDLVAEITAEMSDWAASCGASTDSSVPAFVGPYAEQRAAVSFYQAQLKAQVAGGTTLASIGQEHGGYWQDIAQQVDIPAEEEEWTEDPETQELQAEMASMASADAPTGDLPDPATSGGTEGNMEELHDLLEDEARRLGADGWRGLIQDWKARRLGWVGPGWITDNVYCCWKTSWGEVTHEGSFIYRAGAMDLQFQVKHDDGPLMWYWTTFAGWKYYWTWSGMVGVVPNLVANDGAAPAGVTLELSTDNYGDTAWAGGSNYYSCYTYYYYYAWQSCGHLHQVRMANGHVSPQQNRVGHDYLQLSLQIKGTLFKTGWERADLAIGGYAATVYYYYGYYGLTYLPYYYYYIFYYYDFYYGYTFANVDVWGRAYDLGRCGHGNNNDMEVTDIWITGTVDYKFGRCDTFLHSLADFFECGVTYSDSIFYTIEPKKYVKTPKSC